MPTVITVPGAGGIGIVARFHMATVGQYRGGVGYPTPDRNRTASMPLASSLVVAGRGVAGGVQARDAVGLPVGGVAAAVDRHDGRGDPLLQRLDLEAGLPFFLLVHVKHSSVVGQGRPAATRRTGPGEAAGDRGSRVTDPGGCWQGPARGGLFGGLPPHLARRLATSRTLWCPGGWLPPGFVAVVTTKSVGPG